MIQISSDLKVIIELGVKPVRAKRMAELCAFGDAGGTCLVDLTTSDFSQDVRPLTSLSA